MKVQLKLQFLSTNTELYNNLTLKRQKFPMIKQGGKHQNKRNPGEKLEQPWKIKNSKKKKKEREEKPIEELQW